MKASRHDSPISRSNFAHYSSSSILLRIHCAFESSMVGSGGNLRRSSNRSFLILRRRPPLLPLFRCSRAGLLSSLGILSGITPAVEVRSERRNSLLRALPGAPRPLASQQVDPDSRVTVMMITKNSRSAPLVSMAESLTVFAFTHKMVTRISCANRRNSLNNYHVPKFCDSVVV